MCIDCKFEKCYCNQKRSSDFHAQYYIIGSDYLEWDTNADYVLPTGITGIWSVETFSKMRPTVTYFEDGSGINIAIKDKYAGTIKITVKINNEEELTKEVYIKTV